MFILIMLVFYFCPLFSMAGFAMENSGEDSTLLVQTISNLKNPFLSLMPKPKPKPVIVVKKTAPMVVIKPKLKPKPKPRPVVVKPPVPPVLKLDGMVWGELNPQAIIDGEVLGVGDKIKGAKIVSITRKGVKLDYNGVKVILTIDK